MARHWQRSTLPKAGNTMVADTSYNFDVDTIQPTGTVTVGTALLYDGDYIQEITVDYDEPMDGASTPTIVFTGATGTFTSNADGTWASATQSLCLGRSQFSLVPTSAPASPPSWLHFVSPAPRAACQWRRS